MLLTKFYGLPVEVSWESLLCIPVHMHHTFSIPVDWGQGRERETIITVLCLELVRGVAYYCIVRKPFLGYLIFIILACKGCIPVHTAMSNPSNVWPWLIYMLIINCVQFLKDMFCWLARVCVWESCLFHCNKSIFSTSLRSKVSRNRGWCWMSRSKEWS